MHRVPIRCSPRKLSLNLTNPRRVSGDSLATPSPTLQRTPSYTALLEPNSQATDNFGRTPLLRASLTSHHSSTLPSRGSCSSLPAKTAPPSCNCPGHLKVCLFFLIKWQKYFIYRCALLAMLCLICTLQGLALQASVLQRFFQWLMSTCWLFIMINLY